MAIQTVSYVLDTSAYSAFNRGDARLKEYFSSENSLLLPLFVIGELRAGFAAGTQQTVNEALLQRFLDSPNVQILMPTLKTTKLFATIYAALRSQGTPIGTTDIWIAACTIEQNAQLVTLDADYKYVKALKRAKIS